MDADVESPRVLKLPSVDLLALHERHPDRYPYLLQTTSRPHHQRQLSYDILFARPSGRLWLEDGRLHADNFLTEGHDFLANLQRWHAQEKVPATSATLPFRGGWFLYLGYELAAQIEPSLRLPRADDGLPTAFATRCAAALIYDHDAAQIFLVAEDAHDDFAAEVESDILRGPHGDRPDVPVAARVSEEDPALYLGRLRRIDEYIHAGDVFQVNLSRRWTARFDASCQAPRLYRRLRLSNPGPYSGIARWGGTSLLSSSPERLVRLTDGKLETRPIAGTRPRRGGDDAAESGALLCNQKERAEHIMLIDLERNDLGRVCKPGSVRVDELMTLESYAHVHHIVSRVIGDLRDDIGPGDVIRAVFPGGTITGCPKVRCMEIIAELEGAGRGAYTGSMGFLNRDGSMDLNILIRSIVHRSGLATLRAGAGIVADSVPERELEETRAKARGMLRIFQEKT